MKRAALIGVLLVVACHPVAEQPQAAPSIAASQVPAVPAPADNAGKLTGSVSPLSGTVTGFHVRVTGTSTIVALDADVLFDFDQATLRPDATPQLAKTAELIRTGGDGAIGINGYTDARGGDAYNLDLSKRRAETVATWMREQPGVRRRTFSVIGKGEADPVAPNTTPAGADDPAGRAKNRRVEVVIPKAED